MKLPEELLFRRRPVLPVMIAAEAAECGLAAMAMIARYHGHDVDLNGLRQKFPLSMAGTSLRGLMGIADELGFSTRALRAELGGLKQVVLPAIIHWDLSHYVVLKSVSARQAVIHDPQRGRITVSIDELSQHFTGIVLEMTPAEHFKPIEARAPVHLSGLWSALRGAKESIIFVLVMSLALQIATFALPFQMQLIVDEVVGHNDMDLLTLVTLGFGLLALLQAVLTGLRDWTLQLFGNQVVFQIAGNVFRHLIRLESSYFEKRHVGDILSRLSSIRNIQDALTQGVVSAIIDGAMALIAGIILFIYAPVLAAIVLLSLLIVIGLTLAFYPVIRARTEEMITTVANEQTHLMESIRAAVTVKLMGREGERESTWRNLYSKGFNATVSAARNEQLLTFLQSVVLSLQTIVVVYLGVRSILTGDGFSVGMLFAFLSFRQTFTDRAQSLVKKGLQFGMLGLYVERLGDIVSQPVENQAGSVIPAAYNGNLSLKNVSFRYGVTDRWIFRDISLDIHDGEFIAITGPTGGGKSTLLKLLLGLQKPEEGDVLLDGQSARPYLWRSWRARMGVVTQDDRLMSGGLADNISFFDPDMRMEKVIEAAQRAAVHDDIVRMPMNYLTLVGDMGSSLSGGQRQRVLLARALYRDPKVLILDEGTANLDPQTEEVIADMISAMPVTRIVVAHRPALIERASRVLRVDDGRIEVIR